MIDRALCEAVFREAVIACDPALRVHEALVREPLRAAPIYGLAIGKAALAMARGAGEVARGLVVTNADDGRGAPPGWTVMVASHPLPDVSSLEAGDAAIALVEAASEADVVLALISGGASALVERPTAGVTLAELREHVFAVMASGASIRDLNAARTQLSAIKGGKLAAHAKAPVVTLVVSDVIGDDPAVIGSGPTVRAGARVEVIAPMASFGTAAHDALAARGIAARWVAEPVAGPVDEVASELARQPAAIVAWGEPTVRVPADHGDGGRAQQLALLLARELRGTARAAFVAGSDGIDGSSPHGGRGAAGAFVDGTTWDAIARAGIDPAAALARCDAGTALATVDALVITGPTGINHADVIIVA